MEIDNQKYIYSKNDKILKSGKIDYSVAKPIERKMSNSACFGAVFQSSKLKNPSKNDLKTTLLFYALCSYALNSQRSNNGKTFPYSPGHRYIHWV